MLHATSFAPIVACLLLDTACAHLASTPRRTPSLLVVTAPTHLCTCHCGCVCHITHATTAAACAEWTGTGPLLCCLTLSTPSIAFCAPVVLLQAPLEHSNVRAGKQTIKEAHALPVCVSRRVWSVYQPAPAVSWLHRHMDMCLLMACLPLPCLMVCDAARMHVHDASASTPSSCRVFVGADCYILDGLASSCACVRLWLSAFTLDHCATCTRTTA